MEEKILINESIQAGAPDIKYSRGDIRMGGGQDQQGIWLCRPSAVRSTDLCPSPERLWSKTQARTSYARTAMSNRPEVPRKPA